MLSLSKHLCRLGVASSLRLLPALPHNSENFKPETTYGVRLFLAVNRLGSSSHNPHPDPLPSPAKGEGISSPRLRGEDQGEGPLIDPVTATFNHTLKRN